MNMQTEHKQKTNLIFPTNLNALINLVNQVEQVSFENQLYRFLECLFFFQVIQ